MIREMMGVPKCTFPSVYIRQPKQYSSKTSVYRKYLWLQPLSDLVTMISYFNDFKKSDCVNNSCFPFIHFWLELQSAPNSRAFLSDYTEYLKRKRKFDDSINMKHWIIIEFDNGTENRNSPIIKKIGHKDSWITFKNGKLQY